MNEFLGEERAEIETKMDLALEKFFNNVLDCIILEDNDVIYRL